MSDYDNSSRDELIEKNKELRQIISDLRSEQDEYEKCVARINPPTKTYKELEEKLANAEEQRKKDIDELWTTRIIPLQKKVEEQDIKLSDVFKSDLHSFQRIKELERTIEKQNAIITMAAGYICASKRFSSSNPMDVMKWLMGDM
jgi:predicted nuclease with TOPRIM domain